MLCVASRGDTEVRLTHEQMRIVKYTPDKASREVIKIFAFAGHRVWISLFRLCFHLLLETTDDETVCLIVLLISLCVGLCLQNSWLFSLSFF